MGLLANSTKGLGRVKVYGQGASQYRVGGTRLHSGGKVWTQGGTTYQRAKASAEAADKNESCSRE